MSALPGLDTAVNPRILIAGNFTAADGTPRAGVNAGYVRSVSRAGGLPLVALPAEDFDARAAMSGIHGLVLPGGRDVDPACYGASARPEVDTPDPVRDRFEMSLFHTAREAGLPVLAICRGMQLANVALGGTLWQDLPAEYRGAIMHRHDGPRAERVHEVRIRPGTQLADMMATAGFQANSIHHQAVRDLAPGLAVNAEAPDGVIEGVEWADGGWWMVGIQWHPELYHDEPEGPDQRLFAAFIEAARAAGSVRVP